MQVTLNHFKSLLKKCKEDKIALKVKTHTGWSKDYLFIIGFIASEQEMTNRTFAGVVLSNKAETEGILINNISSINAFVLQAPFNDLESHKEYNLDSLGFKAVILQ